MCIVRAYWSGWLVIYCEKKGKVFYLLFSLFCYFFSDLIRVFDPTVPQYTRVSWQLNCESVLSCKLNTFGNDWQLPDPIPSSWAVHVKPFTRLMSLEERTLALQQENKHFYQITCDNILQYPLTKLPRHPDGYVAILMNPPWALPSEATSDGLLITPKDFVCFSFFKSRSNFIFNCVYWFVTGCIEDHRQNNSLRFHFHMGWEREHSRGYFSFFTHPHCVNW